MRTPIEYRSHACHDLSVSCDSPIPDQCQKHANTGQYRDWQLFAGWASTLKARCSTGFKVIAIASRTSKRWRMSVPSNRSSRGDQPSHDARSFIIISETCPSTPLLWCQSKCARRDAKGGTWQIFQSVLQKCRAFNLNHPQYLCGV